MLERPAEARWWGAVADLARLLAGTRLRAWWWAALPS